MTDPRSDDYPCPRHPKAPIAPGLQVCAKCANRMGDNLRYLSARWHMLAWLHTAASATGGTVTVHREPPTPCRIDVLDLQRDITTRLHAWCRLVVEDRDLSQCPQDAPQQALWLLRHVEWLCGSPFVEDAVDELEESRRDLAHAIGDRPPGQRIACPIDDCPGLVRVDMADPEAFVTCRACGYTTSAGMLLRLVASGAIAERDPVDADAITHQLGIPRSTLDRWARAGRIRRDHGRFWLSEVIAMRKEVAG